MALNFPVARPPVALTDAASIDTNAAAGNFFAVTLTASRTMAAPQNPQDGQLLMYKIKQGGSGSYTLTWASGAGGFQFCADLPAPTLSTSVGTYDYVGFRYDIGSGKWNCLVYLKGFA
jgi:hypothetical protein